MNTIALPDSQSTASWFAFTGEGGVTELVAFRLGDKRPYVTYVSSAEEAEEAVKDLAEYTAIYATVQGLHPGVSARYLPGRWYPGVPRCSDRDVTEYRVLYIDVDAVRPTGISATEAEKEAAAEVAGALASYLIQGLSPHTGGDTSWLAEGDTGNGYSLYVAIEPEPNSKATVDAVKQILSILSQRYSTEKAHVDTAVFNPSRLTPLYGTWKRKGADTGDRPHRPTLLHARRPTTRVRLSDLLAVAQQLVPAQTKATRPAVTKSATKPGTKSATKSVTKPGLYEAANGVDVHELLDRLGVEHEGGKLAECPWCGGRGGCDVVGNGVKCLHASCADKALDGYRTPVDVAAETLELPPKEAAEWIVREFGLEYQPRVGDSRRGRAPTATQELVEIDLHDTTAVEAAVEDHGASLAYCKTLGGWLVWDGKRYVGGDAGAAAAQQAVVASAKCRLDEAVASGDQKRIRWAKSLLSAGKVRDMLYLMSSHPTVAKQTGDFDQCPHKIHMQNGVLDLNTGALTPHSLLQPSTKVAAAAYDPAAQAPRWLAFLERVVPDPEVRGLLQRLAGMLLLGRDKQSVLPICWGGGRNGKSTLFTALACALGDYACYTHADALLSEQNSSNQYHVATLAGVRLAVAEESSATLRLDEAAAKRLASQERLSARHPYGRPFEFQPSHTLVLCTNHRPRITGSDTGIWRRVLLIPFTETIREDEEDVQLASKLEQEIDGIFNWAYQGYLEWKRIGLCPPPVVADANDEYKADEDVVGAFLAECTTVSAPEVRTKSQLLYRAYCRWAEEQHARTMSLRAFGESLRERGCKKVRAHGVWYYVGLSVAPDAQYSPGAKVVPILRSAGRSQEVQ